MYNCEQSCNCKWKRRISYLMDIGLLLVLYGAVCMFIVFACNPYIFGK